MIGLLCQSTPSPSRTIVRVVDQDVKSTSMFQLTELRMLLQARQFIYDLNMKKSGFDLNFTVQFEPLLVNRNSKVARNLVCVSHWHLGLAMNSADRT